MCNLYSLSKHQAGILQMVRAMTPEVGNFPPLPGIFPDYQAPVIRATAAGERELATPARPPGEWPTANPRNVTTGRTGLR